MKIKITILLFLLIGTSLFTSCEDFLKEEPYSFLDQNTYFENATNANAALISVYASLGNSGVYWNERVQQIGFWGSDIGTSNTGNASQHQIINFSWDSNNQFVGRIWEFAYEAINRANYVIDNVSKMDESMITDQQKNEILGEAKFIRANLYFDLVQCYGSVPLKLIETKAEEDAFVGLSSEEEIYAQIVEDLTFAAENMATRVRGSSDSDGRADSAAAKGLLGKVYLTMSGFPLYQSDAATKGLKVLKDLIAEASTYGLGLEPAYLDAFDVGNKNGKEDVFSIQFKKGFGAANAGLGSLLHIQFAIGGRGSDNVSRRGNYTLKPVPKLIFTFLDETGELDVNDERYLQLGLNRTIDGRVSFNGLFPGYKNSLSKDFPKGHGNFGKVRNRIVSKFVEQEVYDQNTSANDGDKNLPILRWAEVLLCAAELENIVNGPSGAYQYLDEVRNRSNASLAPRGMLNDDFSSYILDERLRELHGEGQRWFDLKRTQTLITEVQKSIMDYSGVFKSSKIDLPEEKHYYLPYPYAEVVFNDKIDQRVGY